MKGSEKVIDVIRIERYHPSSSFNLGSFEREENGGMMSEVKV